MITLTAGASGRRVMSSGHLVVLPDHVEPYGDLLRAVLRRQRTGVVTVVVQRSEQALHPEAFRDADPVVVILDENRRAAVVADVAIHLAGIEKACSYTILSAKLRRRKRRTEGRMHLCAVVVDDVHRGVDE